MFIFLCIIGLIICYLISVVLAFLMLAVIEAKHYDKPFFKILYEQKDDIDALFVMWIPILNTIPLFIVMLGYCIGRFLLNVEPINLIHAFWRKIFKWKYLKEKVGEEV